MLDYEQDLINELNEIPAGDWEAGHQEADEVLLKALEFAGYSRLVQEYRHTRKRITFQYT